MITKYKDFIKESKESKEEFIADLKYARKLMDKYPDNSKDINDYVYKGIMNSIYDMLNDEEREYYIKRILHS